MTLIGPKTRINILSLSAADLKPAPAVDDDMTPFEDFDEQDW